MKKKQNNKPIYGDNDQMIYEELIKNEKDINAMVDIATERALKKRSTTYKKNKKVKDDTVNSGKKREPLKDMDAETFDLSVDSDLLPNAVSDASKKKEKKKGKGRAIIVALILIFLSVGAYFGYPYAKPHIEGFITKINNGNQPSITDKTILPTAIPTIDPTTTPLATVEVEETIEGRLSSKEDKEYSVEETLEKADVFNTNLITYYNEYTNSVVTDTFEAAITKAKRYEQMVTADRNVLMEYTDVFATVGGGDFLNTVIDRYNNAINMFAALTSSVDKSNMMANMNIYIQQENYLSGDSKASLIEFLTTNNIEYTDNDDYVTFSLFDTNVDMALGNGDEVVTEESVDSTVTDGSDNSLPTIDPNV